MIFLYWEGAVCCSVLVQLPAQVPDTSTTLSLARHACTVCEECKRVCVLKACITHRFKQLWAAHTCTWPLISWTGFGRACAYRFSSDPVHTQYDVAKAHVTHEQRRLRPTHNDFRRPFIA